MSDRIPNTASKEEVRQAFQHLIVDTNGVTQITIGYWNAAYLHKTTEDLINGLVKCNGAGVYSAVTDSSTNWNSAYSHKTTEDALSGLVKCNGAGVYSAIIDNSDDWNAAYSAALSYDAELLCLVTAAGTGGGGGGGDETDPIFAAWQTANDNHDNWDTAYGWGDHSTEGYLTAETDPTYTATLTTTNATVTTIATVAIPAGKVVMIEARMVAIETADTTKGLGALKQVVYHNSAGTATMIGTIGTSFQARNPGTIGFTFTVSGSNVLIQVTGVAATTINWLCSYKVTSIS